MFQDYLTYKRKDKHYELLTADGELVDFQSGPAGKLEAMRYWIGEQSPHMLTLIDRLIETNPHISKRIYKAADMALSGMVRPIAGGWMVVSSQGDGEYHVNFNEKADAKQCGCFDFAQNESPVYITAGDELMQVCKHVLAVQLWNQFIAEY